jgi:uncharacterized protein YuzE
MPRHKIIYNYDDKYDILYITIRENEPSLADEKNGYLIRKSLKSGKFTGITIFDFKKKQKENKLSEITEYIDKNTLNSIKT